LFASPGEAIIHTLNVALSAVVLAISGAAYRKRGGKRYLFLTTAFAFLAAAQLADFAESYYLTELIFIPYIEVHLSHFLDLGMLISFGMALLSK
jgi:hypothetical protein